MDNEHCFLSIFVPCNLIVTSCFQTCELCIFPSVHTSSMNYRCRTCNIACCLLCFNCHFNNRIDVAIRCFKKYMKDGSCQQLFTKVLKDNVNECSAKYLEQLTESVRAIFPDKWNPQVFFNYDIVGFYFSDEQMCKFLASNSNFITLCKICNFEFNSTLYFFTGIDSNGNCEIVGICALSFEDEVSLSWLCNSFKTHCDALQVLFLDPRIQHRGIIQECFPGVKILLSPFYTLILFKSHVEAFEVVETENKSAIKIFRSMLKTSRESDYLKFRDTMWKSAPSVAGYYEKTWHSSLATWAVSRIFETEDFLKPITLFHQKLSEKITAIQTLHVKDIAEVIFNTIQSSRKDHCLSMSAVFQDAKILPFSKNFQREYTTLLTHYAGELVIQQFSQFKKNSRLKSVTIGTYQITAGMYKNCIISSFQCCCDFFCYLALPCWHLLLARKMDCLPLFDRTLCSSYWHAENYYSYFFSYHQNFLSDYGDPFPSDSAFENYKAIFNTIKSLQPHLEHESKFVNNERYQTIIDVFESWMCGMLVSIEIYPQSDFSHHDLELHNCPIEMLSDMYGLQSDCSNDGSNERNDFDSVSSCSINSDSDI